jgi:hypothetical protein
MDRFSSGTRSDRVGIQTRDGGPGIHRQGSGGSRRSLRRKVRLSCERLEGRELLSTPGYDYNLSGLQWPDPSHITYSIAPDGVFWGHGTNDLNARFAQLGDGTWQLQIARALATWESVANLNIAQVPDSVFDLNALGLAQGDPRFGDIRFGGYPFANDTTTLAKTYEPPPNGATEAGDVEINTALNFNIGKDYDLYSVLLHETGHSLGLEHVQDPADVMDPTYQGVRSGLGPGDIAGIQAIYGARTPDRYQSGGEGISPGTAVDLSGGLAKSTSTTVGNLSLSRIGDTEFFTVVAPSWGGSVLQVTAAAGGISLLSPKVELFSDTHQLLAQAAQPAARGDDTTASFSGVVPGQTYTIAVTGATGDVFDVGGYRLNVVFPDASLPVPPSTPIPIPSPSNPVGLPPAAPTNGTMATATALGPLSPGGVIELGVAGSQAVAWFEFHAVRAGTYAVSAPGAVVTVYNARARRVAGGVGGIGFRMARRGATAYVKVASPTGQPVANSSLTIVRKRAAHAVPHPGGRARFATPGHSPHHPPVTAPPAARSPALRRIVRPPTR